MTAPRRIAKADHLNPFVSVIDRIGPTITNHIAALGLKELRCGLGTTADKGESGKKGKESDHHRTSLPQQG